MITGIGSIPVKVPRSRDRKENNKENIIRFASQLLPPYVRRSKSIEATLPYLYLKGISSGDFSHVMPVLLGKDAVGFSGDTVLRLCQQWKEELHQWNKRRLDSTVYVYLWADGIYFQVRLEDEKQCIQLLLWYSSSSRQPRKRGDAWIERTNYQRSLQVSNSLMDARSSPVMVLLNYRHY